MTHHNENRNWKTLSTVCNTERCPVIANLCLYRPICPEERCSLNTVKNFEWSTNVQANKRLSVPGWVRKLNLERFGLRKAYSSIWLDFEVYSRACTARCVPKKIEYDPVHWVQWVACMRFWIGETCHSFRLEMLDVEVISVDFKTPQTNAQKDLNKVTW